jgi:hypothetical protein
MDTDQNLCEGAEYEIRQDIAIMDPTIYCNNLLENNGTIYCINILLRNNIELQYYYNI